MDEPLDTLRYPASRLAGLRAHTAARQQDTCERLAAAIREVQARGEAVSVRTIRAACGLDYASYARNPAALALFRAHSAHLALTRRRTRGRAATADAAGDTDTAPTPRDRLLHYPKRALVERLRDEMRRRQEADAAHARLLHACLERDARIASLEARVAELEQYRGFVDDVRTRVRREEHTEGR